MLSQPLCLLRTCQASMCVLDRQLHCGKSWPGCAAKLVAQHVLPHCCAPSVVADDLLGLQLRVAAHRGSRLPVRSGMS